MTPQKINRAFGKKIRDQRMLKGISIRKFAEQVILSPTAITKIEQGELIPSEKNIVALANALSLDKDDLLALANRVAPDLEEIILEEPQAMAKFLRSARGLSSQQLLQLAEKAEELQGNETEV